MAGLCERSNEPPGSLKAICKEEDLDHALADIRSGKKSIREAAKAYGIDKSLLSRRLLGKGTEKTGRKTPLTSDQEMQPTSHLLVLAKCGFALTKK
ncbi:hypothetical protein ANN_27426 [Periplaneta americana]|uniref:HTH psq-type domain-containing protein n=1 Tax=Periplaneta americana TaxID=6978 RepID=A0ABQ8RVU0_PERAM|nr:hypothetical protein ANN_27426 [Periplaneta americana]